MVEVQESALPYVFTASVTTRTSSFWAEGYHGIGNFCVVFVAGNTWQSFSPF